MAPVCITLTDAQEQDIISKIVVQIQHILPHHIKKHVKENIRPVIQDLVNEDDSVLDATTYLPGNKHENPSSEQTTPKNDHEMRISNLEKLNPINPPSDFEKRLSSMEMIMSSQIRGLQLQIDQLNHQQQSFLTLYDENYADIIQEREANKLLPEAIKEMDKEIKKLKDICDALEQYSRHEILEFHDVPYCVGHGKKHNENTTDAIVELVSKYLGLNITKYDISVSHRMNLPGKKGSVPPIYCRFVHRALAHKILARSHWLKFKQNRIVQKIKIKPNLTLTRRNIYEQAEKELKSYKYTWSKNGNVFVRKTPKSKSIKVNTKDVLDKLIASEKKPREPAVCEKPAAEAPAAASFDVENQTSLLPLPMPISPSLPLSVPISPSLHVPQSLRAPQSLCSSPLVCNTPLQSTQPTAVTNTVSTLSYIANDIGYNFTAFERYQLKRGNRNSLLSPTQQRLMYDAISHSHANLNSTSVYSNDDHRSESGDTSTH